MLKLLNIRDVCKKGMVKYWIYYHCILQFVQWYCTDCNLQYIHRPINLSQIWTFVSVIFALNLKLSYSSY